MRCFLVLMPLVVGLLFGPHLAGASAITIREAGMSILNANTVVEAGLGETVSLEIVLDTGGLSFEGYSYDLDFTSGTVSSIALSHASLSPLVADLLGSPVIDDTADTLRNVNQGTLGSGLASGVYVIDTLNFVVDSLPTGGILVNAFLGAGDTFGLGDGTATPTFYHSTIVPEPATALLLAGGLFGLTVIGRRRGAN